MKYPDITDDKFNTKINHVFKKYTIKKKHQTYNEICFPKKYELQLPQIFLSKYINPHTPYKRILIYHRIGAGKTCSAIQIAEQWKHIRNIIIVLPASLISNFRMELRSPCTGNNYLSENDRMKLDSLHPNSESYKEIIRKSDERIDKYYNIYSYNKFVDLIDEHMISLRNAILIIDEIQNMVSYGGTYYNKLYALIHSASKDLRIVLLSATPMFDKPNEIALTINLLRSTKDELPVENKFNQTFIDIHKHGNNITYKMKNIDLFKKYIKGYISYFRGAPSFTFPEIIMRFVKCEMSDFQLAAYRAVLKHEEYEEQALAEDAIYVGDLPNNFMIGTRIVSNIVFPNKRLGESGLKSLTLRIIRDNLEKYSVKFHNIMRRIRKVKGKVFVYSSFKEYGGIESFIKVLDAFGYTDYNETGEGRKRYAVWSGDESLARREHTKNIFNMIENTDGSKIKIILGTMAIKEGISLLDVKQVHIIEPYWNKSRLDQILGRANRYCSHKNLPKDERILKMYVYLAVSEKISETVDQYINKLSIQKHKIISQFERAIQEAALDCQLNKNANNIENNIKCDA